MANKIEQPSLDLQEALSDVMDAEPEVVTVNGKKRKVTWLHNYTVRRFSRIMVKEKDPWKRNVKACACVLLNRRNGLATFMLLRLWHWLYWRWLYYVVDIDQVTVAGVLDASKKKIQSTPLMLATILATGMMDTAMTMARHELGPAVRSGAQPTP